MSPDPGGDERWTTRMYRRMLRFYDPGFRARYGKEMERVFARRERDAARAGRRWRFVAGAAVDAVRNGMGTRWDAVRRGRGVREGAGRHGNGRGFGMSGWSRDLRYAARTLRKNPGFTVVAVATIALGIGANTAIFSVVRTVLLAPLPYEEPDELVTLWGELRARGVTHFPFSPPDYREIAEGAGRIEEMAAVFGMQQALTGDGDPVQVEVAAVTWNFFDLLGAAPQIGRNFTEADDLPNPPGVFPGGPGALPSVVILSHGLWERRFAADPGIVGAMLELNGQSAEVLGVMPEGFEMLLPAQAQVPSDVDLWTTARADYANAPDNNVFLRVVGRLADGATLEEAQAQVDRIVGEISARSDVKGAADWAVRIQPLHADLTDAVRPPLMALFGAVVFVLLIACANVANLMLVRAQSRERELAVHAALGGSRSRIMRRVMMESGLLALAGALVGTGLASVGIDTMLAMQPGDLPRVDRVDLDGPVLGFTLGMALLAALVFGALPSAGAGRLDLTDTLKGRGGAGGGRRAHLVRHTVVVGEVALSLVLLIGAGLMLRSFAVLGAVDPGYDAEGVLVFEAQLPGTRYPDPRERDLALMSLRERLEAIPGVESASGGFPLPLGGMAFTGRYGNEEALSDPSAFGQADYRVVRLGYFEAMGTRLLEGRSFTAADVADSASVVVVDDRLARVLWPGESAVGRRLLVRPLTPEPEWVEVVGVVEHQRAHSLASDGPETVYFTDRFMGSFAGSWVVRTSGDPASLVDAVRAAVAAVDPTVPVADPRPLRADVAEAMASTRFILSLIGVFGIMALILATVGLYGVLAYVVRQRTAEIGVRVAFGAERGSILALVVRQGLRLAFAGVVLGLLAALALTRSLDSLLVGVSPTDPVTFVGITGFFLLVSAAAAWVPALRATRVDPVVALRED